MIELLTAHSIYKPGFEQVPNLISGVQHMEVLKLSHILGDPTGEVSIQIEYFLTQFIKSLEMFDDDSNVNNAILLFKTSPGFGTVNGFIDDREAAFIKMTID